MAPPTVRLIVLTKMGKRFVNNEKDGRRRLNRTV
jgi:hypothetical protein